MNQRGRLETFQEISSKYDFLNLTRRDTLMHTGIKSEFPPMFRFAQERAPGLVPQGIDIRSGFFQETDQIGFGIQKKIDRKFQDLENKVKQHKAVCDGRELISYPSPDPSATGYLLSFFDKEGRIVSQRGIEEKNGRVSPIVQIDFFYFPVTIEGELVELAFEVTRSPKHFTEKIFLCPPDQLPLEPHHRDDCSSLMLQRSKYSAEGIFLLTQRVHCSDAAGEAEEGKVVSIHDLKTGVDQVIFTLHQPHGYINGEIRLHSVNTSPPATMEVTTRSIDSTKQTYTQTRVCSTILLSRVRELDNDELLKCVKGTYILESLETFFASFSVEVDQLSHQQYTYPSPRSLEVKQLRFEGEELQNYNVDMQRGEDGSLIGTLWNKLEHGSEAGDFLTVQFVFGSQHDKSRILMNVLNPMSFMVTMAVLKLQGKYN